MERDLEPSIYQVETEEETKGVKELFRAHLQWAGEMMREEFGISFDFIAKHEKDMSEPDIFQPPYGRLLIAVADGEIAGVGCLRKLGDETGEIKRMYVRPEFRGKGIGSKLVKHLIDEAREIGYSRMRLDSARFMREAHSIYRSAGFKEIEPYPGSELPEELRPFWIFMERYL